MWYILSKELFHCTVNMSDWHQGLSSRVIFKVNYRVLWFPTHINASQTHPGSLWTETFSSCGSEKSWFVLCKNPWKQHWRVTIIQVIVYLLNTQKGYIKIECSFVFVCFTFLFLHRVVLVMGQVYCCERDGHEHFSEVHLLKVSYVSDQNHASYFTEGSY